MLEKSARNFLPSTKHLTPVPRSMSQIAAKPLPLNSNPPSDRCAVIPVRIPEFSFQISLFALDDSVVIHNQKRKQKQQRPKRIEAQGQTDK